MVAASRALASRGSEPLLDDPFAEPLVRAVGHDFFTRMMDGEIDLSHDDSPFTEQQRREQIAVRTRFFDDFFLDAAGSGIRQAVILAAGLDARAYRLPWPAGTVVIEVDQPEVVAFKTKTLAELGATSNADRRAVGIDLREDWPAALRHSGFDAAHPTAWIAEGLLMYLPPDAQDRLFDNITELSAPGSKLATEFHRDDSVRTMTDRAAQFNQRWANLGCDIDLSGLFFDGERSNVVDYLTDRGWQVTTRPRREFFTDYGRVFPEDETSQLRNIIAVTATLR